MTAVLGSFYLSSGLGVSTKPCKWRRISRHDAERAAQEAQLGAIVQRVNPQGRAEKASPWRPQAPGFGQVEESTSANKSKDRRQYIYHPSPGLATEKIPGNPPGLIPGAQSVLVSDLNPSIQAKSEEIPSPKKGAPPKMHLPLTLVALAATTPALARQILFLPLNETSGTEARDYSGQNRHARYVNSPSLQGANGARLDGVDDYIQLPNDLMRNQYSISASIEVNLRDEQQGYYFIFGIGNTGSNGDGNGYIFATGDPELRAAITPNNWENEAEIRTNAPLQRNVWRLVTFVIESAAGRIGLYLDGQYLGGRTNGDNIIAPGSIGTGSTQANYIGRSTFRSDKYLAASVRNFRLWDHALTQQEVQTLPRGGGSGGGGNQGTGAEDRVTAALLSINIQGLDNVRQNLNLPTSVNGVRITWWSSDPNIISTSGRVNRPGQGDVLIILTAIAEFEGASGERSFEAIVRRNGT